MTIWKTILVAALAVASSPVLNAAAYEGTSKEQAACRPDVRRFCYKIKPGSSSLTFLSCLQAHRTKLTKPCLAVLVSHGQ